MRIPFATLPPHRAIHPVLKSAWLAMFLAALVLVPRSLLIVGAHSETMDEEYHLTRGVRFWSKSLGGRVGLNDPPLGEGIIALPLVIAGTDLDRHVLYGQRQSPEMLRGLIAVWKGLLFLPLVGVAFAWTRGLYGVAAGWLAAGLLTFEPNFAAHLPLATLDVLAVEGIVIAGFLAWRYARRPSARSAAAVAVATAVAVMLKHTAIILPGVILMVVAISRWGRGCWSAAAFAEGAASAPGKLGRDAHAAEATPVRLLACHLAVAIIVGLASLWALTLFDISRPFLPRAFAAEHPAIAEALARPLPGGVYLKSLATGLTHAREGHSGYLLGEVRQTGWWYYFPLVATYKVPIVIGALALAALASIGFVRARWEEWSLLLPLLAWLIFIMTTTINIGFRHALPAYAFGLLLTTRFLAAPHVAWKGIGIAAIVVLALEGIAHHPNYLSYINWPRHKPYLAINDSNIDWGQSLEQVRRWLDAHPQTRPVYLRYFGRANSPNVRYHLGDRVAVLNLDHRPPVTGILIISPYWEAGVGDPADRYRLLRTATPIAVIGDCMRVYDLERVKGWRVAHRRAR